MGLASATPGWAKSREIRPFALEDINLSTKPSFRDTRIALSETLISQDDTSCLWHVRNVGLLYKVVQFGPSCATQTYRNSVSWEIFPELALRTVDGKSIVRPGILFGFVNSFALSPSNRSQVMYVGAHYKFVPNELAVDELKALTPGVSNYMLQRWADVLESSIASGLVLNFGEASESPWALRLQYSQTLPLGLRRVGGLSKSAALEVKQLETSIRKISGPVVWGGGFGYALVTFDTIRIGVPIPNIYLGYEY